MAKSLVNIFRKVAIKVKKSAHALKSQDEFTLHDISIGTVKIYCYIYGSLNRYSILLVDITVQLLLLRFGHLNGFYFQDVVA
jgi:hypothetical protein